MHYSSFPYFGGSMETLLSKVKIVQGRRVIFLPKTHHNEITLQDMNRGLVAYEKHSGYEKTKAQKEITQSYYL